MMMMMMLLLASCWHVPREDLDAPTAEGASSRWVLWNKKEIAGQFTQCAQAQGQDIHVYATYPSSTPEALFLFALRDIGHKALCPISMESV